MAATTLDEETTKKVIRQVEFYFGDSNLATDNFMIKSIEEGEDGMVSLALICSFTRMRGHLGLGNLKADEIPEDTVKAVAEVLRNSEIVKISDDGTKIGRKAKLAEPEELIGQIDSRTLAASPLPYDAKLELVELFFSQFAKVNSVRLPSHVSNKKLFCGTALVEFSAEEDLPKIMGQILVYEGVTLEFRPKKEFDVEREAQEAEFANSHSGSQKKNSAEANYPKGLIVAFKLKRKSLPNDSPKENPEDDSTSTEKEQGTESKVNASDDSTKSETETKEGEDDKKPSDDTTMSETETKEGEDDKKPSDDTTMSETEIKEGEDDKKPSEDTNGKDNKKAPEGERHTVENCKDDMNVVLREDLKAVFQKYGVVKFIDFRMGAESGYLRFEEAEAAQKARAAAVLSEENGLLVKNFIATLEPVTGDAEKNYWKQIAPSKDRFRDNHRGHRGRGGKHRGGWKHGGRSRDNESGGRPNKVQRVAA